MVFNPELKNIMLLASNILSNNLVEPICVDTSNCDLCGVVSNNYYQYIDGYNKIRFICSCCGLVNIPFNQTKFRLNNINKGFLVLNPKTEEITIITSKVNLKKAPDLNSLKVNWIEMSSDGYKDLLDLIKSDAHLKERRYVLKLSKRVHNHIHLLRASFDNHVFVATETKGENILMQDTIK